MRFKILPTARQLLLDGGDPIALTDEWIESASEWVARSFREGAIAAEVGEDDAEEALASLFEWMGIESAPGGVAVLVLSPWSFAKPGVYHRFNAEGTPIASAIRGQDERWRWAIAIEGGQARVGEESFDDRTDASEAADAALQDACPWVEDQSL